MTNLILTLLFIMSAAVCKAVADTLTHHYWTSIFRKYKAQWWNPAISWQYVGFIKYTRFRPDAWHLANSGMIVSFCLAVALHRPVIHWTLELIIAGILFNLTFNLFYNRIFKAK